MILALRLLGLPSNWASRREGCLVLLPGLKKEASKTDLNKPEKVRGSDGCFCKLEVSDIVATQKV